MSREIIKNGILDSLESIIEMVSTIDKHEDFIPQIETDILLERIRRLYADVLKLNDFQAVTAVNPKQNKAEKVINPANQILTDDLPLINEEIADAIDPNLIEEKMPEVKTDDIKTNQEEQKPITETKSATEVQADLFENPSTLAEKLTKESVSLHEKISNEKMQENVVVNKINNKPVDNLKKAIGLNDKFLFINHLFSGDMKAYDQMIEQLNSASGLQKAIEIINEYSKEKNWDISSAAFCKLRDLTEKRFQNQ